MGLRNNSQKVEIHVQSAGNVSGLNCVSFSQLASAQRQALAQSARPRTARPLTQMEMFLAHSPGLKYAVAKSLAVYR